MESEMKKYGFIFRENISKEDIIDLQNYAERKGIYPALVKITAKVNFLRPTIAIYTFQEFQFLSEESIKENEEMLRNRSNKQGDDL